MRPVTPIHGDLHLVLLASWDSTRVPPCRPVCDHAGPPTPPWLAAVRFGSGLAGHAPAAGDSLRCRGTYRF